MGKLGATFIYNILVEKGVKRTMTVLGEGDKGGGQDLGGLEIERR
ncbi:Uncharacterised protein [Porphyromonas cangingivalis]|nr:Uncharacterised protein [Porphyromonas cangingivalis]